jgi:hypothetical protein
LADISYENKRIKAVTLRAMNSDKPRFFKGFQRHVAPDLHEEIRWAKEGVYGQWWKFMHLSPVLWFAITRGVKPKNPDIARLVELNGNFFDMSFSQWWTDVGRKVFSEAKRPPKVELMELDELLQRGLRDDRLYIEVPLNITMKTIMRQFGQLIRDKHDGRDLNVLDHSQAILRLNKKLKKFDVIERMYWVHLYRELYPEITAWQIGDRLRVAPALDVVNFSGTRWRYEGETVQNNKSSPVQKMQSLIGRDLYRSNYLLLNMERGSFPNYDKIELSERHQPFGIKLQTEFRHATESTKDGLSEWHEWLDKKLGSNLRSHLKTLHRFNELTGMDALDQKLKAEHFRQRDRFIKYIKGEMNHWA